jgi:endonuclease/exonuclease/phosphatase family metal-dependent hydrolase
MAERRVEALLLALALGCALLGFGLPEFGGAGYVPPERPDAGLRVVTWNLGSPGGRARDRDLKHVAVALLELDADVVCLQELAGPEQLAELLRLMRRLVASVADGGVALLVRRLESEPARAPEVGRPAVLVDLRASGAQVRVAGLHASPWSARARNAELGACTGALLADPADAYLLLGDLNLDPLLDGRSDLFSDDAHLDLETYNALAERMTDCGLEAGPTAEPDRRLDYVFARGLRVLAAGVWTSRRVGDMDHRPLVVDLAWD